MSSQVRFNMALHSPTCHSAGKILNKLHNILKNQRKGNMSHRTNNSQLQRSLVNHSEINTDVNLKFNLDNKNRNNMANSLKNKQVSSNLGNLHRNSKNELLIDRWNVLYP